jgi:hypothetical protein
MPTPVAPKFFVSEDDRYVENPAYRGEAYFQEARSTNLVRAARFASNAMEMDVEVRAPGTLVINQNFHRDWSANRGTLTERDGLVAVRLTEPGTYVVRLTYRPRAFYAGVALSLLILVTLAAVRRRQGATAP